MSATIMSDPAMLVSAPAQDPQPSPSSNLIITQQTIEAVYVICDCCGLSEECTPSYIGTIRERYLGKWICGLCSEAVKYEIIRTERLITTEEAMARHMNMCNKFKSSGPPSNPTFHLISAMRQILRRSLDSSRALRSTAGTPVKGDESAVGRGSMLARSESCFATLTGS